MQVLIVDDNQAIRTLLKTFLGDVARIEECSDGDQAVAAFAICQPDWVVMDVRMQRVGGIAATKLLKAAYPSARVLMLSKHRDADIQAAAREAGACGYLVKDDLNAVRRFLLANEID